MDEMGQCLAAVEASVGRVLTDAEKRYLNARVKPALLQLSRAAREGTDPDALLKQILKAEKDGFDVQRQIAKRNAALNYLRFKPKKDYLFGTWGDDLATGIEAMFNGVNVDRFGARDSLGAAVVAGSHDKVYAFARDLEQGGLLEVARQGVLDKDMFLYAHARDHGGDLTGFSKPVKELYEIYRRHQDLLRDELNAEGAFIGDLPGYLAKRTHDMDKIAKAAGPGIPWGSEQHFRSWADAFKASFKLDEAFGDLPPSAWEDELREMFTEFTTGQHMDFEDVKTPKGAGLGFDNLGKRNSKSRKFEAVSPEAEYEYFKRFGHGSAVYDTILHTMQSGGRDLAVMRAFGPSARANITKLMDTAENSLNKAGRTVELEKFRKKRAHIEENILPVILNESHTSGNNALRAWSLGFQSLERMMDLGFVLGSSVGDLATYASRTNMAAKGGAGNYFKELGEAARHQLSLLGRGVREDAKVIVAEQRGLLEGTHLPVSHMFAPGGVSKSLNKASGIFLKYAGAQTWWNGLRSKSLVATALRFGGYADRAFDALPEGMQANFRQYGFTAKDWDLVRKAVPSDYRGDPALTAKNVADLPLEMFEGSPATQRRARDVLADKMGHMANDIANATITMPTAFARKLSRGGSFKEGTAMGELTRHLLTYKSFVLSFYKLHIDREMNSYHPDRVGLAASLKRMVTKPGSGPLMGVTGIITSMMAAQYLTDTMRSLAAGKQPEIPTDLESAAKVMSKAILHSGSMGFFGSAMADAVDSNKPFQDLLVDALKGPSIGRMTEAGDVLWKAVNGDFGASGQKAAKLALRSVPGQNLFYTQWLTNYLIRYRLLEMTNPGILDKMEDAAGERGTPMLFPHQ